jgi:hypothetical protein
MLGGLARGVVRGNEIAEPLKDFQQNLNYSRHTTVPLYIAARVAWTRHFLCPHSHTKSIALLHLQAERAVALTWHRNSLYPFTEVEFAARSKVFSNGLQDGV